MFESKYEPNSGGWLIDGKLDYGSVELEVGRLLNAIVLVHQPKTILETGTYFGYSTSCLASALMQLGGERVVYTIDCQANELLFSGSCFENYINVIFGKSQDVNQNF